MDRSTAEEKTILLRKYFLRINMYITWSCIGIICHQWDDKLKMLLKIPNNLCKIFTVSFLHIYSRYKANFTIKKCSFWELVFEGQTALSHSCTRSYFPSVLPHLTGDCSGYCLIRNNVINVLPGSPGWPLLSQMGTFIFHTGKAVIHPPV